MFNLLSYVHECSLLGFNEVCPEHELFVSNFACDSHVSSDIFFETVQQGLLLQLGKKVGKTSFQVGMELKKHKNKA